MRETLNRIRTVAGRSGLFKLLGVVGALLALPGRASAQVPPDEAWRTLATEHFRVTFPAHLEDLGRSAADRAERAWTELSEAFVEPPGGPIDLLISDHVDYSNGFAQYTPSNRITVYARPPVDNLALGYFDEWMELVITHELAHILHLDRTGVWYSKLLRSVFGRVAGPWPFFPAATVPRWVTEGLATWYESDLTDAGRAHGTAFDMIVRTAALEGRFEDIGQAGGDSPQWPDGDRYYAYGSLFFEHLLDRYGEERMADFVDAVAGQWVPYRLDAAGRSAFGVSLDEAWDEWAEAVRADVAELDRSLSALGPITEPEAITSGARDAIDAQVSPDGSSLVYARSDGKSDTQFIRADPDGSGARKLARFNRLGPFDFMSDGRIVAGQLEVVEQYRVLSDIYVFEESGASRRVTRGARLSQPTVGPDAAWAVAVQEGGGTSSLVRVDLATGGTVPVVDARRDVHWAFPALSPDGRWIAVTRWAAGAQDIVILDLRGNVVSQVTADRAMDVAPDWSSDGRWLVWSSDRTGILNVLAASVDPATGAASDPVMLTNVRTGAAYPSVDPGAEWLYFSGYHVDGWEVERIRFDPDAALPAPPAAARFAEVAPRALGRHDGQVRDYSALPTLLPTYWEPTLSDPVRTGAISTPDISVPSRELLGFAVGAQTGGSDMVGRHAYGALARVFTTGGKAEGAFAYSYAGLGNPVLGLNLSQGYDDGGVRLGQTSEDAPLDVLYVLERDRRVSASVSFSQPTWRRSLSVSFSGGVIWRDDELLDDQLEPSERYRLRKPSSKLGDFSATLNVSTARSPAFQMGGASGAALFVRAHTRRELSLPDSLTGVVDFDGSSDGVIGRLTAYLSVGGPGHAAHVLALRTSGGAARGPGATSGFYDVGGASGSPETISGLELFGGSPIFFPVRGYARSTRFGRYAWSASAEYRFPLLLLNRGVGAWPGHLDRVIGAFFFDAGNAWGTTDPHAAFQNTLRSSIASAGAEITAQIFAFYRITTRVRTGVAFPLVEGGDPSVYLRVGLPF